MGGIELQSLLPAQWRRVPMIFVTGFFEERPDGSSKKRGSRLPDQAF
jgi:hypothetical protein